MPKLKPRALRQRIVMPSVRSRKVACAQRSRVGHREDALQPLDFSNAPFRVHPPQYLTERRRGQFEAGGWPRLLISLVSPTRLGGRVAEAFDFLVSPTRLGAPSFAQFAKGGYDDAYTTGLCSTDRELRRPHPHPPLQKTQGLIG